MAARPSRSLCASRKTWKTRRGCCSTSETPSSTVVRMACQNCQRAIHLFGQHYADKQMRPCLRTEGEASPCLDARQRRQSIRTADDQRKVLRARITERRQHFGKVFGRHALALGIE